MLLLGVSSHCVIVVAVDKAVWLLLLFDVCCCFSVLFCVFLSLMCVGVVCCLVIVVSCCRRCDCCSLTAAG